MSAALGWRLARRELRGGARGFRVFVACLALGVGAIAAVGTLAEAVKRGLAQDARTLVGGDVELSFTHRRATPEQLDFVAREGAVSLAVEMRAMARSADKRALVELKAVDGAYPLLGAIGIEGAADLGSALSRRDGAWGALVERSAFERLGVGPGERVKVGDESFEIRGVVVAEPDRSANFLTLGPRLMVSADSLPSTGLIQPGSLARFLYRVRLAPGVDAAAWTEALKARFPEAGWRIRGLSEAAPGVRRWIDRIAMFLTLVGLSALLVGGVGVANAVKRFVDGKRATIATLKCLGATSSIVGWTYAWQIGAMAAIGIALGMAVGALAPLLVAPLLPEKLPAAAVGIYPAPLAVAAAFGALTALAFSLAPIARSEAIAPGALFRDTVSPSSTRAGTAVLLAASAALAALAGLAVSVTADKTLGLGFVGGAIAVFALFFAAGRGIAAGARRVRGLSRPVLRLAIANLHRPGSPMRDIVLALGVGLTVLVTIALVHGNFARQLREQIPEMAPSFFFIDLQSDRAAEFDALLAAADGVGEVRRVPSLRGRIVKLNGVSVESKEIAPEAQWALGSDRGLTYAATPPVGSTVVAGAWWPPDYRGPPLISFDAGLARGMGLGVGDTMTINVLGREIEARIANLRAIDWTTLGINFAIVFAPGALDAAPHTFIATAQVRPEREDAVERLVVDRFPNVSAIRVKSALATVDRTMGQIAAAAQATAGITLVAGTLVLAGAVVANQRRRVYDAVVMKVLGARRREVLAALLAEFGMVGLAAASVAALLGSALAYVVMRFYLKSEFVFLGGAVAGVALGAMAAVMALGLFGTWRALGQKPAPLLRNE